MSMKRLLLAIMMCLTVCQVIRASADTLRYRDIVFRQVKVDSLVYSTQNGLALLMDVYQPVGDTALQRPLIILAHGGSFMHGNRKSDCIPAMCRELAMRGFVVASIEYRLTNLLGFASKRRAYASIMTAVADGRNSVRWFINDAAKNNVYHINPNRIFFGGSSAGGILAEHLAYVSGPVKCSPALAKVMNQYLADTCALSPRALRGCISLAGAVLDTNLICTGGPAILHIQGDADHVVPFAFKRPINGLAPFKLAGLAACRPRYKSQRLDYAEYVFKDAGHTTWDWDKNAFKIMIEQVVAFVDREIK